MSAKDAEAAFGITPDSPGFGAAGHGRRRPEHKVFGHVFSSLDFDGVAVNNPHVAVIPDLVGTKDPDNGVVTGSLIQHVDDGLGSEVTVGMDVLRHLHLYIAFKERKLYISAAAAPPRRMLRRRQPPRRNSGRQSGPAALACDMPGGVEQAMTGWRRLAVWIGAFALVLVLIALALWLARARLAEEAARVYFRQHGIDARWCGSGRWACRACRAASRWVRRTRPPCRPAHIELRFDPLRWTPRVVEVRLDAPVLRASIDDQGQVALPGLQQWLDDLAKSKKASRDLSATIWRCRCRGCARCWTRPPARWRSTAM